MSNLIEAFSWTVITVTVGLTILTELSPSAHILLNSIFNIG